MARQVKVEDGANAEGVVQEAQTAKKRRTRTVRDIKLAIAVKAYGEDGNPVTLSKVEVTDITRDYGAAAMRVIDGELSRGEVLFITVPKASAAGDVDEEEDDDEG